MAFGCASAGQPSEVSLLKADAKSRKKAAWRERSAITVGCNGQV